MRHFVQYHNSELMGYLYDDADSGRFTIVTNKNVSGLSGNTVWLISGEDKPRTYKLREVFIVDEVGENDGDEAFRFYASGEGTAFRPPVTLNQLAWFRQFLADYQNFSLGLREVKEAQYIAKFQQLKKQLGADHEIEQLLKSGAAFGNPETNRKVERAAVKVVTDWYEKRGWRVQSVESTKCGYDLLCSKGEAVEHVEVKGIQGDTPSFIITAGETKQARDNPLFVICIVTAALSDSPHLLRLRGKEFVEKSDLTPLAYRVTLRR